MTNAVTVTAPASGVVGQGLAITGTVAPATDTVSLQLAQQNATLPTGTWTPATTVNGAFAGVLEPVSAGNWYVWAFDQLTGLSAVSGVISVPNNALPILNAAPLSDEQAATLLPTNLSSYIVYPTGSETPITLADLAALVMAGGGASTDFTTAALTTLVAGLPTTIPTTAGTLWLDGGVVVLTGGGTPGSFTSGSFNLTNFEQLLLTLPTTLPSTAGSPWLNDGVLTLTGGGAAGVFPGGALSAANLASLMLSLPTALPSGDGVLWLNDGLLTLTN